MAQFGMSSFPSEGIGPDGASWNPRISLLRSSFIRATETRRSSSMARGSTSTSLVQLLAFMKTHPQGRAFFEALPVAGIDGTLKGRMTKSVAKGRIFAKTGTLSTANSLSGYAKTLDGEELIFSILANNHAGKASEVRKAIDQICEVLVEFSHNQMRE